MPASDHLVSEALAILGHQVCAVRWDGDDATVGFDALVFRSCWNYHLHEAAFRDWLRNLESAECVINSLATVRWNLEKRYLLDLGRSVPIVPTEIVESPDAEIVRKLCQSRGWERAVVKPTVGVSAYRNSRLLSAADFSGLTDQNLSGSIMIQPYQDSIETEGERSLIFFDGDYSHAVLKRAAAGDYRVQEEHGGSSEKIDPPDSFRRLAKEAIDALREVPAYARVDVIRGADGPLLMEVELIEPELFVDHAPESASRFAAAILARVNLD